MHRGEQNSHQSAPTAAEALKMLDHQKFLEEDSQIPVD